MKYLLGGGLSKLFPAKADEIKEDFTIPESWISQRNSQLAERLIRFYIGHNAKSQEYKYPGITETIHKIFWGNTDKFFLFAENRTEEVYVPAYDDIVQELKSRLVKNNIQTVYELGTGDGKWLNYLSQQWPDVKYFIGIDISKRQIDRNKTKFKHLTFISSDLIEWVEKNATQNTLYHTNSGVLEYISENSVIHLINTLKENAKGSIILFIEPLYGDYDINSDIASTIHGGEYSYTHNYIHHLKNAGIELISYSERQVLGFRMLIVLAHISR